jgi:hypothetical protein
MRVVVASANSTESAATCPTCPADLSLSSPTNAAVTAMFISAALVPRLSVGLDQAVALPRDSYMQQYYR